jgi:protein SCO1/2
MPPGSSDLAIAAKRRVGVIQLLLLACLCGLLAACGDGSGGAAQSAPTPPPTSVDQSTLHGTVPTGQVGRPEFTLFDTSERPYDFRTHTHGRVTLLYAGYTHCPDECPTTMAAIATALRSVAPSISDQVSVVFVTVDPKRDTAQVLRTWLDRFHPPAPFVGLRGTPAQLGRVEVSLGMPIAKRLPASKSYGSGAYAVSHFDGLLTYGRDDRLQTIYPSSVRPSALASDLTALVRAGEN